MNKIDIPEEKIADDPAFHRPASRLVTAIKEHYKRIHGVQISQKDLEKEILKIVRRQS